jgi:transcriptional regulator with XRE-family HTH domain
VDDPDYLMRLGVCLRDARRRRGLSLKMVEVSSGGEFKASALGAYERSQRVISVARLQRLARFYGVPVDRLLPSDDVVIDLREEASAGLAQL